MSYYINEINKTGKIAVDDTILVKDVPATAGSKMLENFKPLFSAEAVERLEKAGYAISGKTNVGELYQPWAATNAYPEDRTSYAIVLFVCDL